VLTVKAAAVAMKLTGHKTESSYRRDAIVIEADLSAGTAKLATLHEHDRPERPVVVPVGTGKVSASEGSKCAIACSLTMRKLAEGGDSNPQGPRGPVDFKSC